MNDLNEKIKQVLYDENKTHDCSEIEDICKFVKLNATHSLYTTDRDTFKYLVDGFVRATMNYGQDYETVENITEINHTIKHITKIASCDYEVLMYMYHVHDDHGYTLDLLYSMSPDDPEELVRAAYNLSPVIRLCELFYTPHGLYKTEPPKIELLIEQLPRLIKATIDNLGYPEMATGLTQDTFKTLAHIYSKCKLSGLRNAFPVDLKLKLSYLSVMELKDNLLDSDSRNLIHLIVSDLCTPEIEIKKIDTYMSTVLGLEYVPSFDEWSDQLAGNTISEMDTPTWD